MKIYKMLDWSVNNYFEGYRIGGHGSEMFDLGTEYQEVKEKFNRAFNNKVKQMSIFGQVQVLKKTDTEAQIKMIKDRDGEKTEITIEILKIVEVEIDMDLL